MADGLSIPVFDPSLLPFKAICMDGELYTTYASKEPDRFPIAQEDVEKRADEKGKMWGANGALEFVDGAGRYYIARDVRANREALIAAGFEEDKNHWTFFCNGNEPFEKKEEWLAVLTTPQDIQEKLDWEIAYANVEGVRFAMENGASLVERGAGRDGAGQLMRNALTRGGFDRDRIMRILLPACPKELYYGEKTTLLHMALALADNFRSSATILPDILNAGFSPFARDAKGIPAFLAVNARKEGMDIEFAIVADAIRKTKGIPLPERVFLESQISRIEAALKLDDKEKGAQIIESYCRAWTFAEEMGSSNNDAFFVPARVQTFLAPITDKKEVEKFEETLVQCTPARYRGVADVVAEFTRRVALPQCLIEHSQKQGRVLTDDFLRSVEKEIKIPALQDAVRSNLFGHRNLAQVIGLSEAWHAPHVIFPDEIIPYKASGEWYPLTSEKVHAVPSLPGVTIHALTNSEELKKEGADMNHCVGGYSEKALSGESHIFSVRQEGIAAPLSTIEASWRKGTLTILQNMGVSNRTPCAEAIQAAAYLKEQIEKGKMSLSYGCGETEKSKLVNTKPPLVRSIGYDVTQENVNRAFQEYCKNGGRRGRGWNAATQKFDVIKKWQLIDGSLPPQHGLPDGAGIRDAGIEKWFVWSGLRDVAMEASGLNAWVIAEEKAALKALQAPVALEPEHDPFADEEKGATPPPSPIHHLFNKVRALMARRHSSPERPQGNAKTNKNAPELRR